ncbi:MAG: hypothetical protein IPP61_12835 [Cytophagaceae bacterium]|nr:hypothetical protein [Cytophagaceae bacterium]MBL0303194.1 hypothetical protein [Cytophagaceae bacterium]MBL0326045.1 hypothetical protein [Cytophagaceae bacterium]
MKNFIKLSALLVLVFVATSCDQKTDKEIETINAELMKGHDEIMPKTMMIADLKKNLLAAAEGKSEELKNQALEISTNLQKAEDDMYLWMENYGKAMNDVEDKTEKLKLYKELNTEVKSLKDLTVKSMDDAKRFVESNK